MGINTFRHRHRALMPENQFLSGGLDARLSHERGNGSVIRRARCFTPWDCIPFLSDKYDITKYPNYKYTADADERNTYDIEKALKPKRPKLKANDKYLVIDAYALEL